MNFQGIFSMSRKDLTTLVIFSIVVLALPIWLQPFGAAYPT